VGAVGELARIREQLERVRSLFDDQRLFAVDERVSGWSPAVHADHLLKVTKSIVDRLPSEEAVPRPLSFIGRCLLALRWIPRGRGRSPERLAGKECTIEELQSRWSRVSEALAAVDPAAVDRARIRNVPHPRFGGLTPSQALRFAAIHNEHHLKIVRDVLR
jgi:hypothetical protein